MKMDNPKKIICRPEECEVYKLPQGRIFIGYSDKTLSAGYLELNPHQELPKHKRPVDEELIQIEGTSIVRIFRSHSVGEVILPPAHTTIVPANRPHIHANRTDKKSLTYWRFDGDITEIINRIRESYPKIDDFENQESFQRKKKHYKSYKKGFRRKYKKL